jgi:transposase
MQIKQFIGIDVSKKTLDITILDSQGKQIYYERITNESKSIKSCFSSFMKQYKAIYEESVFCMEYTGIYNLPLVKWLKNQSANIWMESGSQINKSQGLVRGKNDKVDSLRIANYAFTNRHSVKLWQAPREIINRLSDLLALRSRFVKAKKQLNFIRFCLKSSTIN